MLFCGQRNGQRSQGYIATAYGNETQIVVWAAALVNHYYPKDRSMSISISLHSIVWPRSSESTVRVPTRSEIHHMFYREMRGPVKTKKKQNQVSGSWIADDILLIQSELRSIDGC